jgi:hypothetical protein
MKGEVVRPQQVRQLTNKFEHDPFLLISFQRRIAGCIFWPQKKSTSTPSDNVSNLWHGFVLGYISIYSVPKYRLPWFVIMRRDIMAEQYVIISVTTLLCTPSYCVMKISADHDTVAVN